MVKPHSWIGDCVRIIIIRNDSSDFARANYKGAYVDQNREFAKIITAIHPRPFDALDGAIFPQLYDQLSGDKSFREWRGHFQSRPPCYTFSLKLQANVPWCAIEKHVFWSRGSCSLRFSNQCKRLWVLLKALLSSLMAGGLRHAGAGIWVFRIESMLQFTSRGSMDPIHIAWGRWDEWHIACEWHVAGGRASEWVMRSRLWRDSITSTRPVAWHSCILHGPRHHSTFHFTCGCERPICLHLIPLCHPSNFHLLSSNEATIEQVSWFYDSDAKRMVRKDQEEFDLESMVPRCIQPTINSAKMLAPRRQPASFPFPPSPSTILNCWHSRFHHLNLLGPRHPRESWNPDWEAFSIHSFNEIKRKRKVRWSIIMMSIWLWVWVNTCTHTGIQLLSCKAGLRMQRWWKLIQWPFQGWNDMIFLSVFPPVIRGVKFSTKLIASLPSLLPLHKWLNMKILVITWAVFCMPGHANLIPPWRRLCNIIWPGRRGKGGGWVKKMAKNNYPLLAPSKFHMILILTLSLNGISLMKGKARASQRTRCLRFSSHCSFTWLWDAFRTISINRIILKPCTKREIDEKGRKGRISLPKGKVESWLDVAPAKTSPSHKTEWAWKERYEIPVRMPRECCFYNIQYSKNEDNFVCNIMDKTLIHAGNLIQIFRCFISLVRS